MDITAKINDIVNKLKSDKDLKDKFAKDPSGTIKSITGIDVPKEDIDKAVAAIKTKMTADNLSDMAGKVGNLLGKK